jgi:hypothetical protein
VRALALIVAVALGCAMPRGAVAQESSTPAGPPAGMSLRIIACAEDAAGSTLMRDPLVLRAVGDVFSLNGSGQTIGLRTGSCGNQFPDAACFGAPGGIICRVAVIDRMKRAAAWTVSSYRQAQSPGYERFKRSHAEGIARAFQYADHAIGDAGADRLRNETANAAPADKAVMQALLDYNLAALLGHEISHTRDGNYCPISQRSASEQTGILQKFLGDEQSGRIFAKHSPVQQEYVADRCGLRHIRALNARFETTSQGLSDADASFMRRAAADMLAFEITFGWRRYQETSSGVRIAAGTYGIYSPASYLYAPYRGLLFASETVGRAQTPAVCGYAAEILVQAIQRTYIDHEGGGDVGDDLLAYFPSGVADAWNHKAAWTPQTFSCG